MTHRNNHARSKQKRQKLRLKNFFKAVFERRAKKRLDALKPKGRTFRRIKHITAKDVATYCSVGELYDYQHARNLNQRQKRKRQRSSNHYSKN